MTIESLLIAVLFCVAILPLLAVVFRAEVQPLHVLVGLVLLWLAVPATMVATAVSRRDSAKNPELDVADRPIQVATDQYIGSRACRSCHPHQHATWYDSYHRTMTQLATPQTVLGDFDRVRLPAGDVEFQLDRQDDQYQVNILVSIDSESPGARASLKRPIVMTTGSHHMQVYWFSFPDHTRHLGMLPFVYLNREQRWIPRNSAFLMPPQETPPNEQGRWNEECIQCHATHGRMRPREIDERGRYDATQVDTQVAEFGIACEACHGPGLEHVRENRSPIRRYRSHVSNGADETIVNPARLPHDLSSQVCGQCHGIHFDYEHPDAIRQAALHGNPYRPGDDLAESPVRYLARCGQGAPQQILGEMPSANSEGEASYEDFFWSDGMVRVSGREYNGLVESPCFQRGELSCLNCHQMHQAVDDPRPRKRWASDQLHVEKEGNLACLQCHQEYREPAALTSHTHHAAGSAGSTCYNCHMSYTTYGLLKAMRSHMIDAPSVAASLETGRPNACNQCHLDQTLAWTAQHLSQWYGIESPELSEDEQQVAASVLLALKGDAGQRALMAWSFGWPAAQEVSGRDWMAPYLGQLLEDRYDAVRLIAARSLQTLPGFGKFAADFLAPAEQRAEQRRQVLQRWRQQSSSDVRQPRDAVLIDRRGQIQQAAFQRLLDKRHDPDMVLSE